MGQHVEQLEFLQVAFGDRPALLKSGSFYQRLLAEDEDDLQEQAEEMLKETSLASYYDDVAMPGLELAARDMARRVLARSQVEKIASSVVSLVAELKQYETSSIAASAQDKEQSATGQVAIATRTQICCVAARTPLDFAAATMLAHLLEKEGVGPKVISYEDVSRGRIGGFDAQAFSTICVYYIDASGSPSPLRFLDVCASGWAGGE